MKFFSICEEALSKRRAGIRSCCAVCVLCISAACWAQSMQAPGTSTPGSQVHAVAKPDHAARKRSAAKHRRRALAKPKKVSVELRPAESAPRPATVSLKDGKLTIQANNSDLTQILREVAHLSGMTIDGINQSPRVFGEYGPGKPSNVLTALLAGTGYNFVIVGERADGAPTELLLTARNNNSAALPRPTQPSPAPASINNANPPQQPGAEPDASSPPTATPPPDDSTTDAQQTDQQPTDPQVSDPQNTGPEVSDPEAGEPQATDQQNTGPEVSDQQGSPDGPSNL